jgi:hypothetical protein
MIKITTRVARQRMPSSNSTPAAFVPRDQDPEGLPRLGDGDVRPPMSSMH